MTNSSKKHIITIAGGPGSGKSTAAKEVAKRLGFQHFSSGDLFRAAAKERGVDVLQANLSAEENAEIDHLVDGRLREIGLNEDRQVIDSRTAWHWIPASFKVFLDLGIEKAAERVLHGIHQRDLANEHIPNDLAGYVKELQHRLASETRRYKKLYDINPYDTGNYDLVIDTAANGAKETVELILQEFEAWLKNNSSQ